MIVKITDEDSFEEVRRKLIALIDEIFRELEKKKKTQFPVIVEIGSGDVTDQIVTLNSRGQAKASGYTIDDVS